MENPFNEEGPGVQAGSPRVLSPVEVESALHCAARLGHHKVT